MSEPTLLDKHPDLFSNPELARAIVARAKERPDGITKAQDGEFETMEELEAARIMYNWSGVLWALAEVTAPSDIDMFAGRDTAKRPWEPQP